MKAEWKSIPPRKDKVLVCVNCEQPVKIPGHICDPILPYTCKYCGVEVNKTHHMCKEITKNSMNTIKELSLEKWGKKYSEVLLK